MTERSLDDVVTALDLVGERPLLVTDADEVLFRYMEALEAFLDEQGCYFDWSSFALTGNVRRRTDNLALESHEVQAVLAAFFEAHCEHLEPVPGAAEALDALSRRGVQVVVLSNVPAAQEGARRRALERAGMPYPLVGNTGRKGPATARLVRDVTAPAFFVDDIGMNLASVAEHAPMVRRYHLSAHPRLTELQGPVVAAHAAPRDWDELRRLIEADLPG